MATKKKGSKGLTKTKTIGGKRFTKSTCSSTKTGANSAAKRIRGKGKTARVVKNPTGGYCVYSGAKSKTKKKK